MAAHSLIHQEAQKPPVRFVKKNGLIGLGWPHFWLLAGILGGMLALVALVFFAARVSR